jgi:YtkA-like
MRSLGLETRFETTPFYACDFYGPDGRCRRFETREPFFYLVRRGGGPGSIEAGLCEQARALGARVEFGSRVEHLPQGGIVATGPKAADAIAAGILFETDAPDQAAAIMDDDLAPAGTPTVSSTRVAAPWPRACPGDGDARRRRGAGSHTQGSWRPSLIRLPTEGSRLVNHQEVRMKPVVSISLFLGTLALTWGLVGCRGGQEETTAPPPPAGGPAAAEAALGTAQAAGPFQVTLSTDPTRSKVGETRFRAEVRRDGQPVTDATVNLNLSMTSMTMVGPEVVLKPTGDHYEGTANVSMAGEWEAKTTVSAGGDTGTAVYPFSVSQ